MRVVFDHQVFAFQKYGGISRYICRIAAGMSNLPEHTSRIIAPLHVNAYLADLPTGIVSGLSIAPSDLNQRIARNIGKHIIRPLIQRERPDIVHETYYAAKGSAPKGVPTVLTVHDMIHEIFEDEFPAGDQTRALKRAATLRADHIICVSENTQRDLLRIMPQVENKTSVIRLGFDNFSPPASDGEKYSGRPYLLYVGERSAYKNFSGLLKAYSISSVLQKSFDIRCFGGGPPSRFDLQLIESLGLSQRSIIFETGDDIALTTAYRGATAFVYPSLYEGFGIPPLEAMSADCPVIASSKSSIPEICGNAAAYFEPASPESIKDVIEKTVFNSDVRIMLVAAGRSNLQRFSWSDCVNSTISAYKTLL